MDPEWTAKYSEQIISSPFIWMRRVDKDSEVSGCPATQAQTLRFLSGIALEKEERSVWASWPQVPGNSSTQGL